MSKVSALVSAYYAKSYIDARIINLFGAKGVDLEIIVICQEGSAEDEIASKYAVKVIRTPDIPTIGKAWNLGIIQATGDYLTTANTDDRYHIGGLEAMIETLDQHPEIGLLFSQVDLDNGRYIFPWIRIDNGTGEVEEIATILQRRCIIGPMPLWRKSIHDQVGMFRKDYKVASDYDMWRRMVKAGVKFYYLADSCGVYLRRPDSLEWRNRQACIQESAEVQA